MSFFNMWMGKLFMILSLVASQGAKATTIAVCEPLKDGNPHLSVLIKRNYQEAASLALDHFNADHPSLANSAHRIKWCLDIEEPRRLLERAMTPDVTAMIGFAFTGESQIASQFSESNRLLYLSPAAALDDLFSDGFSKSLGMPMSKTAAIAATWLAHRFPKQKVHVFYANDVTYARFQAQRLKARISGTVDHVYMQADESSLSLDGLGRGNATPLVFLAGYAHHHFQTIKRIFKAFPKAVFIATNQWAYTQGFLRTMLAETPGIQLYAVSDFVDLASGLEGVSVPPSLRDLVAASTTRAKKFVNDHKVRFQRDPEGFSYAVYDAVYLALSTAPQDGMSGEKARADQMARFKDVGWFAGTTGPIKIEKGIVTKPGYLLKWDGKRFRPLEMTI